MGHPAVSGSTRMILKVPLRMSHARVVSWKRWKPQEGAGLNRVLCFGLQPGAPNCASALTARYCSMFILFVHWEPNHISLFVSGVMVQHVYLFVCLDPLCRRRSVFPDRWGRHGPGIWEQGQVHRAGRTSGSWPLDVSPRQPESCSAAGDHSWFAHLVVLL